MVTYPDSDQPLQRLSVRTREERHTFMLTGAPACGKGTIVATMELQAKELFGINWDDTIKINSDNHREIVSIASGMGDDISMHAKLNNAEAKYISNLAYKRVQEQLDKGEGHHLLIDTVSPSKDKLGLGIQNSGSLHVACVSVPVDISVERAFKRGQEIGRYVGSNYLIGAHKMVSTNLLKNVVDKCKDTGATLSIFNTNVPRGEQPIQAMHLDLSTNTAVICDDDAMALIYGKKHIDVKATDSAHVYTDEDNKLDYSYVTELESLGITVTYASSEMQQKIEEIIHPSKSIACN